MAAKKGSGDLNSPLRSLSETLRSLQRETGEMLTKARREARAAKADKATGSRRSARASADNPLLRAVTTLLERWDVPTRADLDAIRDRLDRLEAAIATLEKEDPKSRAAKPRRAASKNRRT